MWHKLLWATWSTCLVNATNLKNDPKKMSVAEEHWLEPWKVIEIIKEQVIVEYVLIFFCSDSCCWVKFSFPLACLKLGYPTHHPVVHRSIIFPYKKPYICGLHIQILRHKRQRAYCWIEKSHDIPIEIPVNHDETMNLLWLPWLHGENHRFL